MVKLFLSYARSDDEPFVKRLYEDLTAKGHQIWWDRLSLPSRGLTFLTEIRDAITAIDQFLLIVGPAIDRSDYVRAEWEYALSICKPVIPILRLGDFTSLPHELRHIDACDFRHADLTDKTGVIEVIDAKASAFSYQAQLLRLLQKLDMEAAPLGDVVAAPSLPTSLLPRPLLLNAVKEGVLSDARQPVVVTAPRRYIGISGMAGAGKSTIAAMLAQDCDMRRAFPDGVCWVALGPSPNLLLRQSTLCKAFGEVPPTFVDVKEGTAFLSQVLKRRACLIILDNACEIDHIRAFDALGPRCSILLTTQDARLLTAINAAEHRVDALDENDALNVIASTLLQPHEALQLSEEKRQERIAAIRSSLPDDTREVARLCGYLPLGLSLCAAQVRDGIAWSDLLTALREADLAFLDHPQGSMVTSLKASIDLLARESEMQAARYRELAVFQDDLAVPEPAILMLWSQSGALDERGGRQLLSTLVRRSMLYAEEKATNRSYHLHRLQKDYLLSTMPHSETLHLSLIETYRVRCAGEWARGPRDGYYFQNFGYHLYQAGMKDELMKLAVASSAWMEAKFVACEGHESYVADLQLLLQDYRDPLTASGILDVARLHAARQVVRFKVILYTNTHLKTLTWLDRKEEARSYAHLRPNNTERVDGLLTIYEVIRERGQSDAMLASEIRQIMRKGENTELWAATIRGVLVLLLLGELDEALKVAGSIERNEERARAIIEVAVAFAEAGRFNQLVKENASLEQVGRDIALALARIGYFDEALEAVDFIEDTDEQDRTLRRINRMLVQVRRLDDALYIAHQFDGTNKRARALRQVATQMLKEGDARLDEILEEAKRTVYSIKTYKRPAALRRIAALFAAAGKYAPALAIARDIKELSLRARALSLIAASLSEAESNQATEIFEEALEAARKIGRDTARVRTLRRLVITLILARQSLASAAFDEWVQTSLELSDPNERSAALHKITVSVHRIVNEYGPREMLDLDFNHLLSKIGDMDSPYWRTRALAHITAVLGLVQDQRVEAFFDELLLSADELSDEEDEEEDRNKHTEALGKSVRILAKAGRLSNAIRAISEINDSGQQVRALRRLVDSLADMKIKDTLDSDLVLVAASRVENPRDRTRFLKQLARLSVQLDQNADALKIALAIEQKEQRLDTLRELAEMMVQVGQLTNALELVQVINSFQWQQLTLAGIAITLASSGHSSQALQIARTIQLHSERERALSEIALTLATSASPQASPVFQEAIEVANLIIDDNTIGQTDALASIVNALDPDVTPTELVTPSAIEQLSEIHVNVRPEMMAQKAEDFLRVGQICAAFACLTPRSPDEFLKVVAGWARTFNTIQPDLGRQVLFDVMLINGWIRLDWREIHRLLLHK